MGRLAGSAQASRVRPVLVAGCVVTFVLAVLPLTGMNLRPPGHVYFFLMQHAPVVIVAGALLWLDEGGMCVSGLLHKDGTFYVDKRTPSFNLAQRYPRSLPGIKIVGESDVKKVVR